MAYETPFTTANIDELTGIIAGVEKGKSRTKERAISRLVQYLLNCDLEPIHVFAEKNFENAKEWCQTQAAKLDEADDKEATTANERAEMRREGKPPAIKPKAADGANDKPKQARVSMKDIEHPAIISDHEMFHACTRVGVGHWTIEKASAHYDVKHHKDEGLTRCILTIGNDEFRGEAKSYKAAIRRAMHLMVSANQE